MLTNFKHLIPVSKIVTGDNLHKGSMLILHPRGGECLGKGLEILRFLWEEVLEIVWISNEKSSKQVSHNVNLNMLSLEEDCLLFFFKNGKVEVRLSEGMSLKHLDSSIPSFIAHYCPEFYKKGESGTTKILIKS